MNTSLPIEDPSECWYIYVGISIKGHGEYIGFPVWRSASSLLEALNMNGISCGYGRACFWTMVF